MKIKDLYYNRPILYDYLLACILLFVLFLMEKYNFFRVVTTIKMQFPVKYDEAGSCALTDAALLKR